MEATPLASLSLTHVHYVSIPPPTRRLQQLIQTFSIQFVLTITLPEPARPNILPLRLARPRPPSPLRNLRDPNMVLPRD